MNSKKSYILQVNAQDLQEIAQVANLTVELPLRLERSGDSSKLYIEENKLKDMLWSFVSQIVPVVTVTRENAAIIPFDASLNDN